MPVYFPVNNFRKQFYNENKKNIINNGSGGDSRLCLSS